MQTEVKLVYGKSNLEPRSPTTRRKRQAEASSGSVKRKRQAEASSGSVKRKRQAEASSGSVKRKRQAEASNRVRSGFDMTANRGNSSCAFQDKGVRKTERLKRCVPLFLRSVQLLELFQ